MPRKPPSVQSAPTLPPEKAIPIIEGLIREAEQVRHTHRESPERERWVHTGEGALRAAFGTGDSNVQAFTGAQCGVYSVYDSEQTLNAQAESQLSGMISVLQSAAEQLRWHLPNSNEVFLPAGSQHDAFLEIRKIVQLGFRELLVVDPWVDHTLWPLLTNLASSCAIRILTDTMKGDFTLEAKKFLLQHRISLEVRRTTSYHDRFIILDGLRCFHLGASIKDAGNKACALSELLRPNVARAAIADVEEEWKTATVVTV